MKALVLSEERKLLFHEVPRPIVKEDEVLIKVKACGICRSDVDMYHNKIGAGRPSLPIVLGHEFSGIVEQIGASVNNVSCGDKVSVDPHLYCGKCMYCQSGLKQFCKERISYGLSMNGGMAEYCAVKTSNVYKINNENLSYEEITLSEPIGCCLHALKKVEISDINRAIIIGYGTLGSLLFRLLRAQNKDCGIAVVDKNVNREKMATKDGANCVCSIFGETAALLDDQGFADVDVVFDCVCNPETVAMACKTVKRCGKIILIGIPEVDIYDSDTMFNIFRKEIMVTGSCLNSYCHEEAISYLENGLIDNTDLKIQTISLDQAIDAFERYDYLEGKTIVTF